MWRVFVFCLVLGAPSAAIAQEEPSPDDSPEDAPDEPNSVMPGVDDFANALVEMSARTWEGPRTPHPLERDRPELPIVSESLAWPVALHADAQVSAETSARVLHSIEAFAAYLEAGGWPLPLPDGGRGGTQALDIYLAPTELLADAFSDGPITWTYLDAVNSYGRLDPRLAGEDLEVCAAESYALAILLQQDPAEAETWRRAYAAWLTWMWTGRFGCADAVERQQQEPERSWIAGAANRGEGGGLLLAMIDARHGSGSGVFLRELWQLARQRTWEGDALRASPDLWQALHIALELSGERLHDLMTELSVARWWLGERDAHSVFPTLRGLGSGATVPIFESVTRAELPHYSPTSPEVEVFGSQYALVDVRGAPPESRLRVWLRGEYGVEWALTGSRLDANGRELGRLSAPPRRGDGRSYLPVELTPDTTHVLVTVTNLSHRLPDADDEDPNARSFRLIYDLVGEGDE